MLLPQQIQAILYHVMMGWVYGCTFSFLCSLTVYLRFTLIKGFVEIIYHIGFTLLLFYGLYKINGGITNLYLCVLFIFGVFLYYKWYLPVCMDMFIWFRRLFRPLQKMRKLMNAKFVGIIKKRKAQIRKYQTAHKKRKAKKHKENVTRIEETNE